MKFISTLIIFVFEMNEVIGQNNFNYSLPQNTEIKYDYNSFINNPDISWGEELFIQYNYPEIDSNLKITNYILNGQVSGKLKSYISNGMGFDKVKFDKNIFYKEVDKEYYNQKELYNILSNSFEFHEILFIENHILKTHIVSGGICYKVITELGLNLGSVVNTYSSLNYFKTKTTSNNDSVVFLGKTSTILNFDSLENKIGIKKTFGMNLTYNLWYDLSKGFNKVVDLQNKKLLDKENVLDYPLNLNEQQSAKASTYFNSVGLNQNWYYNKSKDFFYNKIISVDLYLLVNNQKTFDQLLEKRFTIIFDNL